MSVSKLESLPNEILTDILEKYINGIDIVKAFAFQLNRRFDALILQSQRIRFDFMKCHKDDFRFCIGLLPAYIDKIEELALSEQNTPGQIHAFLSFFPSFDLFKRLRKLYLHINVEAVGLRMVEKALHVLPKTTLDTLSIKIKKSQNISTLEYVIVEIFRMKTLKKFSISCDSYRMNWESLTEISSNIEYLTIYGLNGKFKDLKNIFQCTPNLKYLNMQVACVRYLKPPKRKLSSDNIKTRMSMLHTMILNVEGHDQTIHTMLEPYTKSMPSLHRLEIKLHNQLPGMSAWETLLKTSFPKVTYFNLESDVFSSNDVDIKNTLEFIQTPFWIEKRNFNVIIKEFGHLNIGSFHSDDLQNFTPYGSNKPVAQWWIGPQRKRNTNLSLINEISSLSLSTESSSLLQVQYLDNVHHLVIQALNDNLFELLTRHVNCSGIKYLDVSLLKQENNRNFSLLSCFRNIISLRIKMNQLLDSQFASLNECKALKFLDISVEQHSFDEKDIFTIAHTFPNLEHLTINAQNLQNVPILQTLLPSLRSLTFASVEPKNYSSDDDYEQKMHDVNLRRQTEFLFQREAKWHTVWIDQAALQEPYWQATNSSAQWLSNDFASDNQDDWF